MNDLEIFVVQCYESALNAVQADPLKFSSLTMSRAVCGKIGHPFRECEILHNVEFLWTHHIQYCLQARRLRKLLDQQRKYVPLHLIETVSDDDDAVDDAAEQEEGHNFRPGEDK